MGNALDIKVEYISGISKGEDYDPEHLNREETHAWNIIELEGCKYLVDSTWGAGSTENEIYKPKLNLLYFLTPPDIFLLEHFPENKENQLILNKEIDEQTFLNNAKFNCSFFNLKFINCNCRKQIYHLNTNNKIFKFKHNNNEKMFMMVYVYKVNENVWISKIKKDKEKDIKEEEINDKNNAKNRLENENELNCKKIEFNSYIKEKDNEFLIDILFNKKGKYLIEFYSKTYSMEKYINIVDFIIFVIKMLKKKDFILFIM